MNIDLLVVHLAPLLERQDLIALSTCTKQLRSTLLPFLFNHFVGKLDPTDADWFGCICLDYPIGAEFTAIAQQITGVAAVFPIAQDVLELRRVRAAAIRLSMTANGALLSVTGNQDDEIAFFRQLWHLKIVGRGCRPDAWKDLNLSGLRTLEAPLPRDGTIESAFWKSLGRSLTRHNTPSSITTLSISLGTGTFHEMAVSSPYPSDALCELLSNGRDFPKLRLVRLRAPDLASTRSEFIVSLWKASTTHLKNSGQSKQWQLTLRPQVPRVHNCLTRGACRCITGIEMIRLTELEATELVDANANEKEWHRLAEFFHPAAELSITRTAFSDCLNAISTFQVKGVGLCVHVRVECHNLPAHGWKYHRTLPGIKSVALVILSQTIPPQYHALPDMAAQFPALENLRIGTDRKLKYTDLLSGSPFFPEVIWEPFTTDLESVDFDLDLFSTREELEDCSHRLPQLPEYRARKVTLRGVVCCEYCWPQFVAALAGVKTQELVLVGMFGLILNADHDSTNQTAERAMRRKKWAVILAHGLKHLAGVIRVDEVQFRIVP